MIKDLYQQNLPAYKMYRAFNPDKYEAIVKKYRQSAKGKAANARACTRYRLKNLEFYKQLAMQRRVRKLLA